MTTQTMEKRTRIGNTRRPVALMEGVETYVNHQYHKRVTGAPQDLKPLEDLRDFLMNQASEVDAIVQSIKQNKPLPKKEQLKKVEEPKKTQNKLVAVAPTTGQIQTMISRELDRKLAPILAAIKK